MTKKTAEFDTEDRQIRRLLSGMLPRGKRGQMAPRLGLTVHQLNSYCAMPVTVDVNREAVPRRRRKSSLPARLVPIISELTGDDRLRLQLMGPRLRRLVEIGQHAVSLVQAAKKEKGRVKRGRA